jgi:hypothetical protein
MLPLSTAISRRARSSRPHCRAVRHFSIRPYVRLTLTRGWAGRRNPPCHATDGVALSRKDPQGLMSPLLNGWTASDEGALPTGKKLHADDTQFPVLAPRQHEERVRSPVRLRRDDRRSSLKEPAAVWFDYLSDRKASIHRPVSPRSKASWKRMATVASTRCKQVAKFIGQLAGITPGDSTTKLTQAR